MNKKELIEKIEALPDSAGFIRPKIDKNLVLGLVRELDEPQKVTIPQFVADWYEKRKNNIDFEIWHYLHTFDSQKEDEFKKWMNKLGKKQIQTLVNMHQFGYEVEKEKRYLVKAKGLCGNHETLNCEKHLKEWLFASQEENSLYKTKHTRKELEDAGFGEVFNSPLFEVEEVE